MIPTFALPGERTPGQFGPTIVTPRASMYALIFSISCAGTCSVMQMTVWHPASTASYTASAAKAAGTKIIEVLAPALPTASATVSKTGTPVDVLARPCPGVTPATSFVP